MIIATGLDIIFSHYILFSSFKIHFIILWLLKLSWHLKQNISLEPKFCMSAIGNLRIWLYHLHSMKQLPKDLHNINLNHSGSEGEKSRGQCIDGWCPGSWYHQNISSNGNDCTTSGSLFPLSQPSMPSQCWENMDYANASLCFLETIQDMKCSWLLGYCMLRYSYDCKACLAKSLMISELSYVYFPFFRKNVK